MVFGTGKGMKKILMVAVYYPPILGGTPLRTLKYSSAFSEISQTKVLSISNFKDAGLALDETIEIPKGVEVIRAFSLELPLLLKPFGKASKLRHGGNRRLFYWITPCRHIGFLPLGFLKALGLSKDSDMVYTAYPAPTNLFIGYLLKKIRGKKWLIDMHDSWYPVIGNYQPTWMHKKFLRFLEGLMMRNADYIGVATKQIKVDLLREHPKLDGKKIFLLPQSVDCGYVEAVSPKKFEKFTVAYVGATAEDQNLEIIVKAVNHLIDSKKIGKNEIQLVIGGPENELLLDKLHGLDRNSVLQFLGPVPYKKSIEILKGADILYFGLANKEHLKYAHPSKIFEYLCCGKPLLCSVPEGEASKLIREKEAGLVVVSGSADDLAEKTFKLYRDEQLRKTLGKNALRSSKEYDTKKIVEKFLKEVDQ